MMPTGFYIRYNAGSQWFAVGPWGYKNFLEFMFCEGAAALHVE